MPVYLDYNATAPVHPKAIAEVQKWLTVPANPSSVHSFGREAKRQLENSRKIIANYISAWENEIIFTGSGTESNITALRAFPENRLLVSAVEHVSVLKNAENVERVPVDSNGVVDLAKLDGLLAENSTPSLVSIMLANNETGVIQPIAEISQICKKHGALLHCDAVQALGKIAVDFSLLGADMITISSHKFGGVAGSAALVVKNNLAVKPLLTGGGQELGRRAGTENIAAIAGFSAAIEAIDFEYMKNLRLWLNELENEVQNKGGIVFAKNVHRLPNTSCLVMPNVSNEVQLIDFDLNGFAVSSGSACSSGRIEKSHVLSAMGIDTKLANCAIRVSCGWNTTENQIKDFTKAWLKLIRKLGD